MNGISVSRFMTCLVDVFGTRENPPDKAIGCVQAGRYVSTTSSCALELVEAQHCALRQAQDTYRPDDAIIHAELVEATASCL